MINEEHILVTAKKDYVLLCATDWKTDLVPCPSRIEGMALLSHEKGQAERTSVGQRKVGGSPEEGDSAGEKRHMCRQLLSAPGSWLPEGCSSSSPHRKLDPGSVHWEHLEPGKEMFLLQAIMLSDK